MKSCHCFRRDSSSRSLRSCTTQSDFRPYWKLTAPGASQLHPDLASAIVISGNCVTALKCDQNESAVGNLCASLSSSGFVFGEGSVTSPGTAPKPTADFWPSVGSE